MRVIDEALRRAMAATAPLSSADGGGASAADIDPQLRPNTNPDFGDFQANGVLPLAKRRGANPRDMATAVAAALMADPLAAPLLERAEAAGPGFINIRLSVAALAQMVSAFDSPALGVEIQAHPHAVVIDLCGVNVAKQMHVGHLRATIIGDTLARVFERLGRKVWRENHLGDWGLPIAMTLARLRREGTDLARITLDDLNTAYRAAQQDPEDEAKQTLLRLQSGDPEVVRDWERIIEVTMAEVFRAAELLGVTLGPEHSRGESFFRDRLAGVVDAFTSSGLASKDAGAIVVRFADRERPLLIRKADGGFLYATTDLAAVRLRVQELNADLVVYVVDARQRDHFKDVFDAARLIGWETLPDGTHARLVHIGFGAVLGSDKKPLKTRSGENFTLMGLLGEAVERGVREVVSRASDPAAPTHGMSRDELAEIGRAVGIAAVKYADLGSDVTRDYVFDLDRMVRFDGDTGPYIQYAHARIAGILRKGAEESDGGAAGASSALGSGGSEPSLDGRAPLLIHEPAERRLALHLLQYPRVLQDVARTLEPNRLCNWLHSLGELFNGFYQACPVLKVEDAAVRASRLRLCDLTRRALADGMGLLGIAAPERM
ncbi:MAG: arginine--tRNA ligase [Phycisphaeraceae bacterium]|nr:arginine--tRNA ligase [Phycisphaeraceae bacterium]